MQRLLVDSQSYPILEGDFYEQVYEQRVLLQATAGDLVVVGTPVDQDFLAYLRSFPGREFKLFETRSKGDNSTAGKLLRESNLLEEVREWVDKKRQAGTGVRLESFALTNQELLLAGAVGVPLYGSVTISQSYDDKSQFRRLCRDLEVPIPRGFEDVSSREQLNDCLRSIFDKGASAAVVKLNGGTGGMGGQHLAADEFARHPQKLSQFWEGLQGLQGQGVVVEQYHEPSFAGSVQMEVTQSGELRLPLISEQVLDGYLEYNGFMHPPCLDDQDLYHVTGLAQKVGEFLLSRQAAGFYSLDFIKCKDTGLLLTIELNARKSAVMYPWEFACYLAEQGGSRMQSVATCALTVPSGLNFEMVARRLGELLITPETIAADAKLQGVVPYNIGHLPQGRCDVLIMAPSREEIGRLQGEAKSRLNNGQ